MPVAGEIMLKISTAVFAFLIAASGAIAADTDGATKLPVPIEQCIRDNAGKVEAAVPNLNDAVDFLVGKVCAVPIAGESARIAKLMQERTAGQWKKMCDEETAATKGTTADGEKAGPKTFDYCAMTKVGFLTEPNDDEGGSYAYSIALGSSPPAAVALAAQLMLDMLLAHSRAVQSR